MSIRIIVETADAVMVVNVGGTVLVTLKEFEIDAPELERFLSEPIEQNWNFVHRQIKGWIK